MKWNHRKRSIQTKYFLAIIMVTIIPLIVAPVIGYLYSSNLLIGKLGNVTDQSLVNIETGMNHIIDDVISASNVIALDTRITEILKRTESDKVSDIAIASQAQDMLHYMEASNLFAYRTDTALIDFSGHIYYTGEGTDYDYNQIIDSVWFNDVLEKKGFFIWEAPSQDILGFNEGITMARLIQDEYFKPLGVLVIHLAPEARLIDVMGPDEELDGSARYLINTEGVVILNSNKSLDYEEVLDETKTIDYAKSTSVMEVDGEKSFVGIRIIGKTGWQLVQITPYNTLISEVANYRNMMLWINLGFIALLLFAVYLVTRQLTVNIKKLHGAVNKVTEGDLDSISVASGSLEVSQLSDSFNYMIKRVNGLIEEVKEVTEKKNATKLEALQAQINPHFLLNTLNGIKLLCSIENAPTAENMLLSLGHLLSNTLGKYNDFITLDEEIECIRSYVRLQKMRYGNTFEVKYNIDTNAKNIRVPVLFLQPIVENAIIHAFDEMDEKGTIIIEAITREDYLEIWVSDNGKGMSEATIEQILKEKPRKGRYSSMGIKNVKERIELYYKTPCGLGIESVVGKGTKTVLLITADDGSELHESYGGANL